MPVGQVVFDQKTWLRWNFFFNQKTTLPIQFLKPLTFLNLFWIVGNNCKVPNSLSKSNTGFMGGGEAKLWVNSKLIKAHLIHLYILSSVLLSLRPSVHLLFCPHHRSVCLSVCLFIYLRMLNVLRKTCQSLCPSVSLLLHPSLCLATLPVSLSVNGKCFEQDRSAHRIIGSSNPLLIWSTDR